VVVDLPLGGLRLALERAAADSGRPQVFNIRVVALGVPEIKRKPRHALKNARNIDGLKVFFQIAVA
jgi:hypothetical protein